MKEEYQIDIHAKRLMGIKVEKSYRKRYFKDIIQIYGDPYKSFKKIRTVQALFFLLSLLSLLIVFLFVCSLHLYVQWILVTIFAMAASFVAFNGMAMKNIPMLLNIIDIDKVYEIAEELGVDEKEEDYSAEGA